MPETIYQILTEKIEAAVPAERDADIWEVIRKKADVRLKVPCKKNRDQYEIVEQKKNKGEKSYIIKDISIDSYVSLNEEEFFVWELIDGKIPLSDICNIFFDHFKKLSNVPVIIIQYLEERNMLEESYWDIYDSVKQVKASPLKQFTEKISTFFLSGKVLLKNIDKIITLLYKKVGWLFLRREAVILYCILIATGIGIYFGNGYFQQEFAMQRMNSFKLPIGLALFLSIFPILLHELAHAFTCKKFGRKINRAGFMLYIGLPVLFVDTTDIWMRPKRKRMLVSVAGPITDLLVGSVCFTTHAIFGDTGIISIFPIIGLIAYIRCLFNFNPLLEFDGYYILMDVLEIPELRKKSFKFISKGGIKRIFSPKTPNRREDYIFLLYGLVSGAYTYGMIFFVVYMWQTKIRSLLIEIWDNRQISIFSQLLLIAAAVIIVIRLLFILKLTLKKIQPSIRRIILKIRYKAYRSEPFLWGKKNEKQSGKS